MCEFIRFPSRTEMICIDISVFTGLVVSGSTYLCYGLDISVYAFTCRWTFATDRPLRNYSPRQSKALPFLFFFFWQYFLTLRDKCSASVGPWVDSVLFPKRKLLFAQNISADKWCPLFLWKTNIFNFGKIFFFSLFTNKVDHFDTEVLTSDHNIVVGWFHFRECDDLCQEWRSFWKFSHKSVFKSRALMHCPSFCSLF